MKQDIFEGHTNKDRVWTCNYCGYRINDIQMTSVYFDYGCPRCKSTFMNFGIKTINKDKNERK